MEKAYDKILGSEVDAEFISKHTSHLKIGNRYQCLYCGENVYLAAADSTRKAPHFRHNKGNNDSECEAYLGQPGAIQRFVQIRKQKQRTVSFYFNEDRLSFEIGLSFSSEELNAYSEKHVSMKIKSRYCEEPFLDVPINTYMFAPGTMNFFTIERYSPNYYLIIDKAYTYSNVIKEGNGITVFKPRLQDKRAKSIDSKLIYTNTKYIVASESESTIKKLISMNSIFYDTAPFDFCTMNKKFYCVEILVKRNTDEIRMFFDEHNMKVEESESLDVLWPPVYLKNSDYICDSNSVYVKSSFPIMYQINTNAVSSIVEVGVYKPTELTAKDRIIITEKNINISILKSELQSECEGQEVITVYFNKWKVLNDLDYFIIDCYGCRKLVPDETIYLTSSAKVLGYKNSHLIKRVMCENNAIPNITIEDILKYHPLTEDYISNEFDNLKNDATLTAYLDECSRKGTINTIVRQYIKKGLL